MLSAGLIDISGNAIYKIPMNFDFSNFNLSRFLLNLYLKDLDIYVNYLSNFFSFKKFLFINKKNTSFMVNGKYKFLLNLYFPLKILYLLRINSFIKKINIIKSIHFQSYYLLNNLFVFSFEKSLSYIRYLDHMLIATIGSKLFFNFVLKKILTFIRSTLMFDLEKISFFSAQDNSIIFLGFNIKLSSIQRNNSSYITSIRKNKIYSLRVLNRLNIYDKKVSEHINTRISFELILQLETIFNLKESKSIFNFNKNKKVWIYLFQLESLRSLKNTTLFLTNDQWKIFSKGLYISIKLGKNLEYQKYLFSLYILKIQKVLKNTIKDSFFSISTDFFSNSFDIFFREFFNQYRKKLFFFYNVFFFQDFYRQFYKKKSFLLSNYIFNLSSNNINSNLIILKNLKNINSKFFLSFEIFFPILFSIDSLKKLGFFHSFKIRPIGKSSFLRFDDISIIKVFGYISYLFLYWYRCSFNFYFVKRFINILRESCFLTLCRKHNKSKTWIYDIYTYDLNIFDNLFINKSYFPSRVTLFQMKRKTFLYKKNLFFDDSFFLA